MSKHNESIYLQKLEFDESLNKSWIAFFIDRVRFTWLILIMVFIAWYIWVKNLPLESMPEVDIWMAYIITTLPGASPESVEDLVTKKIEKQISKVKGIDTITSTSMNSSSMILVQFVSGINTTDAVRELKDKADLAKPDLPEDANESVVKEVAFDEMPIWTFAISWDYDGYQLHEYAKIIRDELEQHPLVSEVTISGWMEKEFWVFIEPQKLEQYGLTLSAVNTAIQSANMTLPIWDIEIGSYKHSINVDSRFYSIEKLKNIVVARLGDTWIVYLSDVADVKESPKKITTLSRLSVWGQDPFNAVTLWVVKKKWWSIVDLVSDGEKYLANLSSKWILPADLQIKTIVDNAKDIKNDLHHLVRDGIITICLVFFSLLMIIWAKEALVAGTAVPIVFLVTFAIMLVAGQTLNFLSMFALILSLWLLVDDAIVVISAINQYKKSGKFTTREAAILVVRDYKQVLITTTLTVVFIFGSMMFMTGLIGSFIFSIPFVISVVLIVSLIVALTLNPALAVMISGRDSKTDLSKHDNTKWWRWVIKKALDNGFISIHSLESKYGEVLSGLIFSKKKTRRFLFSILILFISALALPIMGLLKTEFFPWGDSNNFSINIELEPGTKLAVTSDVTKEIEEVLFKEKEIDSFSTSIWVLSGSDWGSSSSEHYATISVKLIDKNDGRKEKSYDIASRLREKFSTFKMATISVVEESSWPWNSADFEIKIAWDDFGTLDKIVDDVKKTLVNIPGTIDIKSSRKPLPFEFDLALDPVKLALYDVTVPQVASFIRNIVDGTQATKIYLGNEEVIVRTLYDENSVDTFDKIKDITMKNNKGLDVSLRDIVSQDFKPSVFSITREDQQRVVTVSATAKQWFNGQQIQTQFDEKMKNYKLPNGYSFITGWVTEENAKSVASLWVSMMFGLMLIVWLLVLLYDSYRQAVLVMITIPLSLIWVFYGLTLAWQPLSFPWMIWMVALFWIVVRNWIILFDKINQNIDENIPMREAIVDAWMSRLEPVLLTSICTVLWMIPLTVSNPTWTWLGLSIMFGLSTSTFFTLLVLPLLYYIVFRKKHINNL